MWPPGSAFGSFFELDTAGLCPTGAAPSPRENRPTTEAAGAQGAAGSGGAHGPPRELLVPAGRQEGVGTGATRDSRADPPGQGAGVSETRGVTGASVTAPLRRSAHEAPRDTAGGVWGVLAGDGDPQSRARARTPPPAHQPTPLTTGEPVGSPAPRERPHPALPALGHLPADPAVHPGPRTCLSAHTGSAAAGSRPPPQLCTPPSCAGPLPGTGRLPSWGGRSGQVAAPGRILLVPSASCRSPGEHPAPEQQDAGLCGRGARSWLRGTGGSHPQAGCMAGGPTPWGPPASAEQCPPACLCPRPWGPCPPACPHPQPPQNGRHKDHIFVKITLFQPS